jgi:hypothetical protein
MTVALRCQLQLFVRRRGQAAGLEVAGSGVLELIKGFVADETLARQLFEIPAKAMKPTPGQVAKNGKCEDNAPMHYRLRTGETRKTQANRVFPAKSATPGLASTCDESWHAIG